MTDEAKMKRNFRATSKWKKFRAWMKKENKVDAITGKPLYKGWQLHHCDLDVDHYTDLSDPEHFECLNKTSHEMVHFLFRYKNWREVIARTYAILQKMEEINK